MISRKLILSLALLTAFPIMAVGSNQLEDNVVVTPTQQEIQPILQPQAPSRWEQFVHSTEQNAGKILFGVPATMAAAAGTAALINDGSIKDAASIAAGVAVLGFVLSFFTYFGITESLD